MCTLSPTLPRRGREQSIPSLWEGPIWEAEGEADRGRECTPTQDEVSYETVSNSTGQKTRGTAFQSSDDTKSVKLRAGLCGAFAIRPLIGAYVLAGWAEPDRFGLVVSALAASE